MSETDQSVHQLFMFAISRRFDFSRRVRNEPKFAKNLPVRRNITKNNTLCAICDTELRTLKFRVRSWPAPCPVSSTFPDMSEIDRIFRCPDVTGQGGLGFFRPPFPTHGMVVGKSRACTSSSGLDRTCSGSLSTPIFRSCLQFSARSLSPQRGFVLAAHQTTIFSA